jgi:hypothetical protein
MLCSVDLQDSRSLRNGCIVIPPMFCYLLLMKILRLPKIHFKSRIFGNSIPGFLSVLILAIRSNLERVINFLFVYEDNFNNMESQLNFKLK